VLTALTLPAAARTRPRYGGTLRLETRSDALKSPDSPARKLLFDTLTRTDANGELVPALASHWESQGGNHRWQFYLRSGVRFHDGSPLTAEAVVQAISAACANCRWRAHAVGVSVVITSESPLPGLPAELARSAYAVTRQNDAGDPNGTGPFRFAANSNGILFLAANEDYWGGRPFADAVEVYGNRSIREQWLDFTAGKADLVEVPPELLRPAQQDHLPLLVSGRPSDLLLLSVSNSLVKDDHARESIALALDRAALSNVIFQKQGEITASVLPDALSGYSFLFPVAPNLARSRELRGTQSLPLRLAVDTSDSAMQLSAERLALNLRDAGWSVRVVPQAQSANTELSLRRLHAESADAASSLREMLCRFGDTEADNVSDPASLYRVEHAFLQSHTVVPLLYLPRAYGVSSRAHSLELAPDGTPLVADAWLEDTR
jgi:ABC-type transport system substrate-binding protein